ITGPIRCDLLSTRARLEPDVIEIETQNQQVICPKNISREASALGLPCDRRRPAREEESVENLDDEVYESFEHARLAPPRLAPRLLRSAGASNRSSTTGHQQQSSVFRGTLDGPTSGCH